MRWYWFVTYVYCYMVQLAVSLAFVIAGVSLRLRWFTVTNPSVYFVLLILWAHAMIATAFFIASLFSNALAAVVVTYILTILAGSSSFFWGGGVARCARHSMTPTALQRTSLLQRIPPKKKITRLVIASFVINLTLFSDTEAPIGLLMWPPLAFYRGIFLIGNNAAGDNPRLTIAASPEMQRIYGYLAWQVGRCVCSQRGGKRDRATESKRVAVEMRRVKGAVVCLQHVNGRARKGGLPRRCSVALSQLFQHVR